MSIDNSRHIEQVRIMLLKGDKGEGYDDTEIKGLIATEKEERESADAQLNGAISAEATTRANEDTRLNGLITSETDARQSADTQLAEDITAEETARRQADYAINNKIGNETLVTTAQTLTGGINELKNAITAEATTRGNADNAINNKIGNDTLVTTAQTLTGAVNELATKPSDNIETFTYIIDTQGKFNNFMNNVTTAGQDYSCVAIVGGKGDGTNGAYEIQLNQLRRIENNTIIKGFNNPEIKITTAFTAAIGVSAERLIIEDVNITANTSIMSINHQTATGETSISRCNLKVENLYQNYNYFGILVGANYKLTIYDSKITVYNYTGTGASKDIYGIQNEGKTNITNCEIKAYNDRSYSIYNEGTLNVNNATLTANNSCIHNTNLSNIVNATRIIFDLASDTTCTPTYQCGLIQAPNPNATDYKSGGMDLLLNITIQSSGAILAQSLNNSLDNYNHITLYEYDEDNSYYLIKHTFSIADIVKMSGKTFYLRGGGSSDASNWFSIKFNSSNFSRIIISNYKKNVTITLYGF